jgi:hypothetical protein
VPFLAATGPTFSVYNQTNSKEPEPDSHSVLMLRRQFKVLQELHDNNINPIPNIYWRNKRDRDEWIKWLSLNNSINVISRDFSSTKRGYEFENGIKYLIDIIMQVGRRIHVLLNGIGHAKIERVIKLFTDVNCTYSFLTSDPIICGRRGWALLPQSSTRLEVVKQIDVPFPVLALQNVSALTESLANVA